MLVTSNKQDDNINYSKCQGGKKVEEGTVAK
jgi:hypothetical protein